MRRIATCLAPLVLITAVRAQPSPEAHLGFRPGADGHLAKWDQVTSYFAKVDGASNRVTVETLGQTTLDRPMIAAVVSSPQTIANLAAARERQRRIADPRLGPPEDAPFKPVVLITCSIHSDETASTLMAMELLHELATADDEATRELLEGVIVLLVPSVNPDGVDLVADWYERSKGKPWEGSGMPRLYHHYAGHDTNRDWFMLNLKETKHLTRFLYKEWLPTITWDVHQMGSRGPRLFVPPFFDPVNPNLDPRLNQAIRMIGSHLAADLAAEGRRGVASGVMYDNWWNGGNRTVPQRHNMVGILTEAASVRMATPIFLDRSELRGGGRGFPDHSQSVDFPDPWPGGWWRLRDIVDYELTCARSVLRLAARYGDWFQANYHAMAASSIERGRDEHPRAWIVPADQSDPGTAAELVRILADTGIEVRRSKTDLNVAGTTTPAGSWILPADQPFRAHLKDMMERQAYPARIGPDGAPERPYDVAGWTLPLQMGVRAIESAEAIDPAATEAVKAVALPAEPIGGDPEPDAYLLPLERLADYRFLNQCLKAGVPVGRFGGEVRFGDSKISYPAGVLRLPATDVVLDLYRQTIDQPLFRPKLVGVVGEANSEGFAPFEPEELKRPRIAVYQPWVPSMDEGWTRLVLENHGFDYATLHNAEIRAGGLDERFDVILIPSIGPGTLRDGFAAEATEPAHVGGLSSEGAASLRAFVEAGGRLVCLENSCKYAIETFDLPIKDVLDGLSASQFSCPGSILRAEFPPEPRDSFLTIGHPDEGSVYFAGSSAFRTESDGKDQRGRLEVLARYSTKDVLESGWLSGEPLIAGQAALVLAEIGKGDIALFGFPPQHRGQPLGTFRLLFNSLLVNRSLD